MSNTKKLKFDALDEKNYLVWIRRVQDHMFGKKLLNYYKHAMAEDGAAAADVQLPVEAAAATAIKDKLEELWTFLNEHLTADIYKLTMDPDEVDYGDPVMDQPPRVPAQEVAFQDTLRSQHPPRRVH